MLGHLKALAQRGEIPFVHCGFLAQAHDQRLLAMVSIIQIMDVAPLGGHLRAQPPKLSFLSTVVFAHAVRYTRRGKRLACLSASSRSAPPIVHAPVAGDLVDVAFEMGGPQSQACVARERRVAGSSSRVWANRWPV